MNFDWRKQRIWLAALAVALGASGLFRYSTQGEWTKLSEGLLIGGGVLLLLAIVLSYQELAIFFGHRSSKLGANTLTLTILVLAGLGLVNFFGYRHHKEADLTTERLYSLSDETRNVVTGLKQDVNVIRFGTGSDIRFQDLAAEYGGMSPHLHYREVDPQERPELAQQYNITQLNKIVVSSGGRNETVDAQGISEQDLTNAILKLTRTNTKTICFLEGHGEKSIASQEADGLGSMDHALTSEGYTTKSVNLVSTGQVPTECNTLVVAGPKQSLFPQEGALIEKYLDGGGKAFLMLDPETMPRLDDVLNKWNVNLGTNVAVDASGVGRLLRLGPAAPLVLTYGDSPITKNFNGTMTFFPLARTVTIADKAKTQPQDVELLKTSPNSFTVPNLKNREVRFDPKTDQAGPLNLGVSGELDSSDANGAKKSRLVVIGNSAFADNQWASEQRNGDLFLNTVHWLSEDEDLIAIRPKSPTTRRVNITAAQQAELFWLSIVILPGLVVISGIGLWLRRR